MSALLALTLMFAVSGDIAEQLARPADPETTADLQRVLDGLRHHAGLSSLEPADALRRLADSRAAQLANQDPKRPLRHPVPISDALDDRPELAAARIVERVVRVPAAIAGAERVKAAWDSPETGALALDPDVAAVGIGAWIARDGSLVFLALFRSGHSSSDREALERVVLDQVNEVRLEHGLGALESDTALRDVAREHSEAMLAGGFLGHESADGSMPADRVRAAGIPFRLIGENVAHSLRSLGAVHGVVQEWMDSPLHRHNILTPEFSHTGVGAAIGDDGTVYITQMFRER